MSDIAKVLWCFSTLPESLDGVEYIRSTDPKYLVEEISSTDLDYLVCRPDLFPEDSDVLNDVNVLVSSSPSEATQNLVSLISYSQSRNSDSGSRNDERSSEKIERLHTVASEMNSCESESEIYDLAIDASEDILEFDLSYIGVVNDGMIVPEKTSSQTPEDGVRVMDVDEGLAGKTYQNQESFIVDDLWDDEASKPAHSDYMSSISVPIGEYAVFQATSTQTSAFSPDDLELIELLVSHVTEALGRVKYEKALEESRRKLSTLISNLPGMVYRSSPDHTLDFVSEGCREITGFESDTLLELGQDFYSELVHPDDRDSVLETIESCLAGRTPYQLSYRLVTQDDEVKWVRERGTGVYEEENELVSIEGFITDITERKEREQLEVLNRVLRHNLRNEMNVVLGHAQLLKDKLDSSLGDRASEIEKKVSEVIELSDKSQEVQKILERRGGKQKVVDIAKIVRRTTENVSDEYAEFEEVDVPENTLAYADPMVSSGIREVLENPFEHGDDPDVSVTVVEKDATIEIEIVDDASPIPEQEVTVLEKGETSLQHGSGLGLWIANWVVSMSNGELEFERPKSGASDESGNIVRLRLSKPMMD